MDKIVALCRTTALCSRHEIYGGLANTWDYGPLGAELKKNIRTPGGRSSCRRIPTTSASTRRS